MPSDTRTLIDFATGDNWKMPLELYEKYQKFYYNRDYLNKAIVTEFTLIQYWFTTLTQNEKEQIQKR
jgi:hypothetical protein